MVPLGPFFPHSFLLVQLKEVWPLLRFKQEKDALSSFAERDGLKSWTVIHVVVSCDRNFVNEIVTLVNSVNFVIIRTVRVHLDLLIDHSFDRNFVNGIVTLVYVDFFFKVETPSCAHTSSSPLLEAGAFEVFLE